MQRGLRIVLLLHWLAPELARCQEEEGDPEELAGGEMHLGALKAPPLTMLSLDDMQRLHRFVDIDGNGACSLRELLEHSQRLDTQDAPDSEASFAEKDKDRSGRLSKLEFFSDPSLPQNINDEGELMEEDHVTFRELDQDSSGDIDKQELQDWESGRFHTKAELLQMVTSADSDSDGEVSLDEFLAARDKINGTSAMYHLLEWHAYQEL